MRTALRPGWRVWPWPGWPARPRPSPRLRRCRRRAAPSARPTVAPAVIPAPANAVAATVNGQPVSETAVRRGLRSVPAEHQAEARPEIVNHLIENALIDQYLLQLRIPVEQKDVDKRINEMKEAINKHKGNYATFLKEMALTEAELRQHIAADLRWDRFAEAQRHRQGAGRLLRRQQGHVRWLHGARPPHPADAGLQGLAQGDRGPGRPWGRQKANREEGGRRPGQAAGQRR